MYIIQTNISLDNSYNPHDFQSRIYEIKKQNWEEFKEYILSNENFTEKIIGGTMRGYTKPRNSKVERVLINDEFHLEVIFNYGDNLKSNTKYYMVTNEQFENLLS